MQIIDHQHYITSWVLQVLSHHESLDSQHIHPNWSQWRRLGASTQSNSIDQWGSFQTSVGTFLLISIQVYSQRGLNIATVDKTLHNIHSISGPLAAPWTCQTNEIPQVHILTNGQNGRSCNQLVSPPLFGQLTLQISVTLDILDLCNFL